jgi:nucleotide-binding universal stress UspA family protein
VVEPVPEALLVRRATVLAEAERVAAEHEVSAEAVLHAGMPVQEIVAYADAIDADLTVLGSRGRGVRGRPARHRLPRRAAQEAASGRSSCVARRGARRRRSRSRRLR